MITVKRGKKNNAEEVLRKGLKFLTECQREAWLRQWCLNKESHVHIRRTTPQAKWSHVGPLMDRILVVQSWQWESERRKEANIPWVTQPAFALQGIRNRERERKRERLTRGPNLWWSKGVLISMVCAYILSYKVVILSKDKDLNSRLTKHKVIPIKERRGYLSP